MSYAYLTTNEGLSFTVKTTQLDGVTLTMILSAFENDEDAGYWRKFATKFAGNLVEHLLKQTSVVLFKVSSAGTYQSIGSNRLIGPTTISSGLPIRIHRHKDSQLLKIGEQFDYIFDPDAFNHEDHGGNSKVANIVTLNRIILTFEFPLEVNVNGLPASYRLCPDVLPIGGLAFIPYNTDPYCVMHAIFNRENPVKTALNTNPEYMARFNAWFSENNLARFYATLEDGVHFYLDDIAKLEKQLGINLNVYTIEKKTVTNYSKGKTADRKKTTSKQNLPTLHYRSEYKENVDNIINLIIIPLNCFYDKNKAIKPAPKVITNGIDVLAPEKDYITRINVSEVVASRQAHCCVLDPNVFCKRDSKGNKMNEKICRYCTRNLHDTFSLEEHEKRCYATFHGVTEVMRARTYSEMKDPEKIFKNYSAFSHTPFCTWDFETRLGDNNEHIPLSYSILYFYPFNLKRSRKAQEMEQDPIKLLEYFVEDLIWMTTYHHGIQSVDDYDYAERDAAVIPEKCPWCLKEVQEGDWDWNHSHFKNDTLNKHLEKYVCHSCNVKATIRNKPLKFFAHNASKFDFNLIVSKVINSEKFCGHQFLAKTESRFTQVTFNVTADTRLKISLNDSLMILSDSLGKLANAWIKPTDVGKIKTLLQLYYPDHPGDLDQLAKIATAKQVFPYSALNSPEHLEKKIIPKEDFFNVLTDKDISEEDYQDYLKASSVLEKFIGEDYCFWDYHDFYLQLDVILLALILSNFVDVCYEMNQLNPLAYLSISSYTMGALLAHNKYSPTKIPVIKIPKVATQQFIQKSIRGGFTHCFNKQIPNFNKEKDICSYVDVTSLYPSSMSGSKLPHEFEKWYEGDLDVETMMELMEDGASEKYYFVECDIGALGEEFQDKVSRYPMFPERFTVLPEHLSSDQLYRFEIGHGKELKEETVNTVTFYEKKNYICSYSYLKMARSVGYQVTKIHRIAQFKADFVMKGYIDKIYELKRQASAERDALDKTDPDYVVKYAALSSRIVAYKILLNGAYGSCLVNVERHSETEMYSSTDTEKLRKNISSFRYKSLLHLDGKVLMNKARSSYKLEYPLMLGSAILWESKLINAKFIFAMYDWLKSKGLTFNIIYVDTDSVVYHIPNFSSVFESNEQMKWTFNKDCYLAFDTSGNEEKYQHPETHQALSHFTDETDGVPIVSFNVLASKCYAYELADDETCVKSKGIPRGLQKEVLNNTLYKRVINGTIFDDYLDETGQTNYVCEYTGIAAKQTRLVNTRITKAYVTLVDIKNYYGTNGIEYSIFGSKKHLDQTAKPE